jgi:hypothetical protein
MDRLNLKKIAYETLNAKRKEQYLFQKISGVLADYGYTTIKLADDWQGADFIAQHVDGKSFLKIQLKSRFSINRKYEKKDLYIAFPLKKEWYIFPHDEIVQALKEQKIYTESASWGKGGYSVSDVSNKAVLKLLQPYKVIA